MSDSILEQIDVVTMSNAKIKVIGVGGGGGNAIQKMIDSNLVGVQFIAANTDMQALTNNKAPVKIQLGEKLTRGLGAGSDPKVGKEAAIESADVIKEAIGDADMVFITAGMGGGTGTGAAPIIAQIAKEKKDKENGVLVVAVVTKPFCYEGAKKQALADAGIEELSNIVDNLIIIPNDRLASIAPKKTPLLQMFNFADTVLYEGVRGISDVIMRAGIMNVDFADVRAIMKEKGRALMGTGVASGESRAREATMQAIKSPLLEDISLESAKAILCNVTCSMDFIGEELEEIGYLINDAAINQPMIKYGVVLDEKMGDSIQVTVIATGIEPLETLDLENETVAQGGANTLRFPNPQEMQKQTSQQSQPQITYERPADEKSYAPSRRLSRDAYFDQKLARVSYGQGRDFGNSSQPRYVPGKETYIHMQEDLDIPTFLRDNAN